MDAFGFKHDFSADGQTRLQEKVNEKLKELTGVYPNVILLDYVIILLRGCCQRDEVKRKLNFFLDHASEAFVSWLWDHLTSNLHLYVQSRGDGVKEDEKQILPGDTARDNLESLLDLEKEKSTGSKARRNRDWKGIAHDDTDPLILRSTIDDGNWINHQHHSPVKDSFSPKPQIQRKRTPADGQPAMKGKAPKHPKLDTPARPKLDAPCSILQFAVRDAVKSVQKRKAPTHPKLDTSARPKLDAPCRLLQFAMRDVAQSVQKVPSKPENSFKRLRSVDSSSSADVYSYEQSWRTMPVGIAAAAASSAVKVAAEAANDVVKSRGLGNVFNRLTRGSGGYMFVKTNSG